MDPLERFGISLGQSNGQAAWDGWGRDDMIGTNGIAFVAPEIPTDYVRVGVDNKLYEAAHNNAVVKFGGTVTDANNMPIAGVSVTIGGLDGDDGRLGQVVCDSGAFTGRTHR